MLKTFSQKTQMALKKIILMTALKITALMKKKEQTAQAVTSK